MHADNRDALLAELLLPIPVTRVVVNAIDSAKRPEMQDDHLSFEVFPGKWLAVNPFFDAFESRGIDFHLDGLLAVSGGVYELEGEDES
jgi:hypothetical protein